MTAQELSELQNSTQEYKLIDLREDYEVEEKSIGGERIRMSEVIDQQSELPKNIPLIFHCESGRRSKAVVETLERKFGFDNVYSLEGGIEAVLQAQA